MKSLFPIPLAITVGTFFSGFLQANPSPEQIEFFESRIRPILAQECYECHSEATKSKGGLLLDTRSGWEKGGDSGEAVILPGDPDNSLLLKSIAHEVEDLEMPKAGAKLEDAVLSDFRKWIEDGAIDPRETPPSRDQLEKDTNWEAVRERREGWWSFQPIERPAVPSADGAEHPVDRFLFSRLKEDNLEPSPQAGPRTLLRRLSYLLTGLPPSPEDSTAFLQQWEADPDQTLSDTADRLLASPAFGERWARHWMDWLRYADSHGSEGDPTIPHSWQYRDYLIRALNRDIPYDQLVREHIAGDLLEDPRIDPERQINESAIGTAHLRMVFHGFAPTDALDERVRFTDDQINTVTKAFQGLTVSCARCHDHKFDAISQADYYALFGIFTSSLPATVAIDAPGVLEIHREKLRAAKPEIRKALADFWREELANKDANWSPVQIATGENSRLVSFLKTIREAKTLEPAWISMAQSLQNHLRDAEDARLGDSIRKHWDLTDAEEAKEWTREGEGLSEMLPSPAGEFIMGTSDLAVDRILPSGLYSHLLSTKHRGFLASPPFPLDGEYDLHLNIAGDSSSARFSVQNYPRRGTVYPVTNLTKGNWNWTTYNRVDYWNGDSIHIELATAGEAPILVSEADRSWFGIRGAFLVKKGAAAPKRPDEESLIPLLTGSSAPKSINEVNERIREALTKAVQMWRAGELDDANALFLDEAMRCGLLSNQLTSLPGDLRQLVSDYRQLEAEIPKPTRAPGLVERPGIDQPLFVRGNHKDPGEPVVRRFLEAIDETPYRTEGSGRRQFAEDILREDNPFTARIIVNRVWHHLFGNGLVSTTDNFGRLGEKPSHPELLDYLADRFRTDWNWSIKSLVRELILTGAWQQKSSPSPEADAVDPDNRLLSHFSIRRFEAEAIRDAMLAVSGQLDPNRYGLPVTGSSPRRSVYLRVKRNSLEPLLTTFDFPVPASTVGKRSSTNVPAQSLTLLNDSFVLSQAGHWAKTLSPDAGEDTKIETLFSRALNRPPTEREMTGARNFLYAVDQQHELETQRIRDLEEKLTESQSQLQNLISPVRESLLAKRKEEQDKKGTSAAPSVIVAPYASWDFESDLRDATGGLSGTAKGNARLEDGALVVDGGGFVMTEPLPKNLGEKTLEALVQLDTLNQAGGGVVTIQDLRGGLFDSIVFAERKPNEWLAGSNNHARTLDFGGQPDTEAAGRPVRISLVFKKDGTILGYRDGIPYGKPIRKAPLQIFAAGDSQIVFGLRHGTAAASNKPLKGRIFEARLYDRALTPDEIAATASGNPLFVSGKEILDALSETQREEREKLLHEITVLESKLGEAKKKGSALDPEQRRWQDLAHAIFNLKEFIYLH
ncbi:MAG: DUF1553 domain-containing protein [Verrucomicrobiales bacterium]|nr:DUF1553 domain-containing protein [Verrucomicrobiales bacterium]